MPIDLNSAATTLTNTANKVVSNIGSAVSAASTAANNLKDAVASGVSSVNAAASSISGAVPGVQSALQNALSNVNKFGDIFQTALSGITQVASGISPGEREPNTLSYYSSYNYIFTLSVLDDFSINFPNETYRKGILGPLILKSGSGDPADRIPTANKTTSNPSGSYDFFIENLQIESTVGFEKSSGNTNATGLKFKIIEPYSMGLFFQTLQAAAMRAGHKNYLQMPLLLTIEFKGHVSPDFQNLQVDRTTKRIPLKLNKFGMNVTARGSEYDVSAYPYNERAFSTIYSQLKTDVSIVGKTVGEMLQTGEKSLQKVLNDVLQQAVKRNDVNAPDQILISFPKDLITGPPSGQTADDKSSPTGATVNPVAAVAGASGGGLFQKLGLSTSSINNTQVQQEADLNLIGASTMGFSLYNGADTPFAKDNLAYDEKTGTYKRGNITINPNIGEFRFSQGSDIINAINQVVLMSEYGRTALSAISGTGLIKWWRVETHLYNIPTDANIVRTGDKPKLVVYRVVPCDVDSSYFLPPNSARPGTEAAKAQVVKEYNYIYSGKNVDVLDFNIEFEAGFYTQLNADGGLNSADKKTAQQASGADEDKEDSKNKSSPGSAPKEGQLPSSQHKSGVGTRTANAGGGGLEDSASIAARQFHDAITSGVDMVNLELTILGDPYYIGDSGMGNYSAAATSNRNINADKSMDWQRGPVHILVNFRTPLDINHSTGLYDFYNTATVPQFSGLYQVLSVINNFNKGKFTQVLKLIRMRGQEVKSSAPVLPTITPEETYFDSSKQTFDDGSSIQTFDDGSTLVTDSEGNVSSTPAPE